MDTDEKKRPRSSSPPSSHKKHKAATKQALAKQAPARQPPAASRRGRDPESSSVNSASLQSKDNPHFDGVQPATFRSAASWDGSGGGGGGGSGWDSVSWGNSAPSFPAWEGSSVEDVLGWNEQEANSKAPATPPPNLSLAFVDEREEADVVFVGAGGVRFPYLRYLARQNEYLKNVLHTDNESIAQAQAHAKAREVQIVSVRSYALGVLLTDLWCQVMRSPPWGAIRPIAKNTEYIRHLQQMAPAERVGVILDLHRMSCRSAVLTKLAERVLAGPTPVAWIRALWDTKTIDMAPVYSLIVDGKITLVGDSGVLPLEFWQKCTELPILWGEGAQVKCTHGIVQNVLPLHRHAIAAEVKALAEIVTKHPLDREEELFAKTHSQGSMPLFLVYLQARRAREVVRQEVRIATLKRKLDAVRDRLQNFAHMSADGHAVTTARAAYDATLRMLAD